jgi:predicted DNA-binding protein
MTVDALRGSMVSRSVRLHEDTLEKLEQRAEDTDKGVTVLMREVLEAWLEGPEQFQGLGETGPRDIPMPE